jgi:CubicO group peptidase (beta-lactamase class C family)
MTRSIPRRSLPLFVAALLALLAGARTHAQDAAGAWRGAIELPGGAKLAIAVQLELDGETWRGTIDIDEQGMKGVALTALSVDGRRVRFAIPAIPGEPRFDGQLAEDGRSIEGEFAQGAAKLHFRLERAEAAAELLQARLAGFADWLDESRRACHVPGCAVAIVAKGALLATHASGVRDLDTQAPVTGDSLFAIGSTTKAFTTFVLATLAEAGAIDWDQPVRRKLPGFELVDPDLAARITPRDLVTHRSGMPRHDLVWYGAPIPREELVARLAHLPLSKDLRTTFQYNNLMYVAAGRLAEVVTQQSWEDLVRARILSPLGMTRTVFDIDAARADADHAAPHLRRKETVKRIPFRDIRAVGPAGSIHSSAREMAHWVGLQLARGVVDGKRLLGEAAMNELHTVHMPIQGGRRSPEGVVSLGYALGWLVDIDRGHRRVHHNGAIDGFVATVTLLPDDGLGFVVLANLDETGLPDLVVRELTDRLLGHDGGGHRDAFLARMAEAEAAAERAAAAAITERVAGTRPSRALADFAGEYRDAGYGTCQVRLVDAETADARLRVDFHGIGAELEHWHYDVFRCRDDDANPGVAGTMLRFESGFDGGIDALHAQLEPSLAAIRFVRAPDARLGDPSFLATLAGEYELDELRPSFALEGRRLVLNLSGRHHELAPRSGLVFALEGLEGYSVRFVLDADGTPSAVRFRQPEGVYEARRKATR